MVIITGYGNDAAEARAKAAGVANFLHKPLSPELIEGSAQDALAAPVIEPEMPVAAAPAPATESRGALGVLKNIALFFAAPFIGLAYIIALPFVGLGVMAVLGVPGRFPERKIQSRRRDPQARCDGHRRPVLRPGLHDPLPVHRACTAAVDGRQGRCSVLQRLSAHGN